jgi:hypothetical protein
MPVEILALAIVQEERRFLENGDARLARFDCDIRDGKRELTGFLVRTHLDLLRIRFPKGTRSMDPAIKRRLAQEAFAEFKAAGGTEWYPAHA